MRALLALLTGCAPTKKTAPGSDASTEPAEGAKQKAAKPAKRGAGTVPQAVKQATEVSTPQHVLALDEEWGYESLEETVWLWRKSPSDYWKYFKGSELEAVQEICHGAKHLVGFLFRLGRTEEHKPAKTKTMDAKAELSAYQQRPAELQARTLRHRNPGLSHYTVCVSRQKQPRQAYGREPKVRLNTNWKVGPRRRRGH